MKPAHWLTLGLLAAWLQPFHLDPVPSFYSEWLCATGVLMAWLWRLRATARALPAPAPPLRLAREPLVYAPGLLVAMAALQWAVTGGPGYAESPLFVLAFALLWLAQAQLLLAVRDTDGLQGLLGPLALACAVASGLSTAIQTLQWLGWDGALEPLVFPMASAQHNRPYANLAQPNLVATLHGLGLGALMWWRWQRGGVGAARWALPLLALWTVWGMALSGSRTAALFWLVLAAAWWWGRQGAEAEQTPDAPVPGARVHGWHLLVLAALHLALLAAVAAWQAAQVPAELADRELASASPERFTLWRVALLAVAQRPWLGYGPGGFSQAFFELLTQTPAQLMPAHHAHNLLLQLAVEYGLPLTLLLSAVFVGRLWRLARAAPRDAHSAFALAGVGVLLVHSQLEFPLWYLHFFLVLGWLLVALVPTQAPAPGPAAAGPPVQPGRWLGATLGATMLGLALAVLLLQDQWAASRRLQAFLETGQPQPPGFQGPMFRSLHRYIDHASLPLALPLSDAELAWRRAATLRRPFPNAVLKLALAELAAGHVSEADRIVRLYRQMYPHFNRMALQTLQPLCDQYRQPQVCAWVSGWRELLPK